MRSVGEFFVGLNRRVRKLAGDEAGSPAVEFALVFPIFIAIVLATLQAGTIFLVKAFFESSAEEAARIVLTNQTGSLTAAQFQTEICNQLTALFNCGELVIELEPLPAGTTNLKTMLPTFDFMETSLARRRSMWRQRRRLRHGHVAGRDVSVAGLRRPARAQLLEHGQRQDAHDRDAGVPHGAQRRGVLRMSGTMRIARNLRLGSRAFLADAARSGGGRAGADRAIALMLMSLVVFGGQAYGVQRKVTLAATTVANIFAQANNTNASTITAAELNQILAYPNLVLFPDDGSTAGGRSVAIAGHQRRTNRDRNGLRKAGPMAMGRRARQASKFARSIDRLRLCRLRRQ